LTDPSRRCSWKRELDGADGFAFEEFGVRTKAEAFQHLALNLRCEGVNLVDTKVLGADEISQLLLSFSPRRRFNC
jgi:hypothetical protein